MAQTVFTHNNAQETTDTCVTMTGKVTITNSNALTTSPTKLPVANSYTVTITYANGLVSSIAVN